MFHKKWLKFKRLPFLRYLIFFQTVFSKWKFAYSTLRSSFPFMGMILYQRVCMFISCLTRYMEYENFDPFKNFYLISFCSEVLGGSACFSFYLGGPMENDPKSRLIANLLLYFRPEVSTMTFNLNETDFSEEKNMLFWENWSRNFI